VGLAVLGFEGSRETADFGAIIATVRALGPDLLYVGGLYEQAGELFKQARAAGLTTKFLGPDGLDSAELARIAGDAAVGTYYTAIAGPISAYPTAASFAKLYQAQLRRAPPPFAAQAYDAAAVGLDAILRAANANSGRKPSREQVTLAVRQTTGFSGLTGKFTFNAKGDTVPATYLVRRIGAADPARWDGNEMIVRLSVKPPAGRM
jgi:ABC-type branched-subunit amino acid transport system substrate-binding protein